MPFPRAVVFGCSGPVLRDFERSFFRDSDPLGFILFARNCQTPAQVRALTHDLRAAVGREDAPILIDQEGGRVARLTPPHWRAAPAPARIAGLARLDVEKAKEASRLNARLLAHELSDLGLSVDCAPVLDVAHGDSDPVIGDRAAGNSPELAALLGGAACEGFLAGGVIPVLKHIPGHGRAKADSHKELPIVDASLEDLERVDFAPFKALHAMPWAMTAHVVYKALDPDRPATVSKTVIEETIRDAIGFGGVLISDDLEMKALSGSLAERAKAVLGAGCDLALHCNGSIGEMEKIAHVCPPLGNEAAARVERAEGMRIKAMKKADFDPKEAIARLDVLFLELKE